MRFLLTGSSGLLGSALLESLVDAGHECAGLGREVLANRSPREVVPLLAGADVLIHAAANTNVEHCETDPEACYRDNFLLTDTLARAAAIAGTRLVYISSTGIYGAYQDEPYHEYSQVQPPTHHHRAKHLGETSVLTLAPGNLVVRTGWLFGGNPNNPKNFVAKRIEEARDAQAAGMSISSNAEQRGVPTWTVDVAQRMLTLVEAGHAGVFNCVSSGSASRFEYVQAIVEISGIPVQVVPTTAASFNRKAKVSANEAAVNWKMHAIGLPAMPEWRDSLARYIEASGLRAD